jgi:hypothetical protein
MHSSFIYAGMIQIFPNAAPDPGFKNISIFISMTKNMKLYAPGKFGVVGKNFLSRSPDGIVLNADPGRKN